MKKFLLSIILFLMANNVFAQQKGISYQAVLINTKNISAPGQDVYNAPLTNKNICILFTVLDGNANAEYQEYQNTTTDAFGMVNLVIGTGTKSGGYASLLSTVNWSLGNKTLVVAINALGNCSDYTEFSREKLNYVPYAFFAENASVADGSITTAKLADGAVTDIKVAPGINKSKVGLGNVDNTSDANKPISTATQAALNLKEDKNNKSLNVIADASSDIKYPSVKAIKDYVDGQITSVATLPDATSSVKGKIQLAGDLAGTASAPLVADGVITDAKVAPGINKSKVGLGNVDNTSDANKPTSTATQTALDLKENIANKSLNVATDASSDTKYPSVKALKTYVDGQATTIQAELDVSQAGAGLNTNGTYTANASSNYIQTATSLKEADNQLDSQIKIQADATQLNLDQKLDKVLTTAETIVTSNTNTLSITGLQNVDLNSTSDQTLTVNPITGVIGKTASLKVFKEYVTDYIATDGQTQFSTILTIDDISKVNVYRNGIRIGATKINANTIQIESSAICYANDEIKIVQFN
jgi:hypothetical protein